MHSNRYIFIYSSVMVVLVAVALTVVAVQLKPTQENNIRVEKMQNILASVNIDSDVKNAETLYNKYITQDLVLNSKGEIIEGVKAFNVELVVENKKPIAERKLPLYICTKESGEKLYIVPLRGKGLWGPVWGYISFKSDYNSVAGSMFDHKGETPGLGAEINTKAFQNQYINKQIFDVNGTFVSISTIKGGAKEEDLHGVDAISGGTITSTGVTNMLKDGIVLYEAYFKNQQSKKE